jgi:hypothetical protein
MKRSRAGSGSAAWRGGRGWAARPGAGAWGGRGGGGRARPCGQAARAEATLRLRKTSHSARRRGRTRRRPPPTGVNVTLGSRREPRVTLSGRGRVGAGAPGSSRPGTFGTNSCPAARPRLESHAEREFWTSLTYAAADLRRFSASAVGRRAGITSKTPHCDREHARPSLLSRLNLDRPPAGAQFSRLGTRHASGPGHASGPASGHRTTHHHPTRHSAPAPPPPAPAPHKRTRARLCAGPSRKTLAC